MKNIKILHLIDHMGLGGAQTIIKGVAENDTNNKHHIYSLRRMRNSKNILSSKITIAKTYNKYSLKCIKKIVNLIKKMTLQNIYVFLFN
jgi:hypothetical protein